MQGERTPFAPAAAAAAAADCALFAAAAETHPRLTDSAHLFARFF